MGKGQKICLFPYVEINVPLDAPIFIGFITPESFDTGEDRLVSLCTLTRLSYVHVLFDV
jgi:hypothetical protein